MPPPTTSRTICRVSRGGPLFSFLWLRGADCCRAVFIEDGSTGHGEEGRKTDSCRPAVVAPLPSLPLGDWLEQGGVRVALSASVDSRSVRSDGEEEEVAGFSVVSLFFVVVSFLFFWLEGFTKLAKLPPTGT